MPPQAKECPGLPAATRSDAGCGTIPSEPQEEPIAHGSILDFWPPNTKEQMSVVLSHPVCGNLLQQP